MQVLASMQQTHDSKVGMEAKVLWGYLVSGLEDLARPELWFFHWPR